MNLTGKRGVVLGVLNKRSLAAGCAAHFIEAGAQIICSYLPAQGDDARRHTMAHRAVPGLAKEHMLPCDASDDESMARFFQAVEREFGTIDFLIHAISFVPRQGEESAMTEVSRSDFLTAMNISVFSMILACKHAKRMMPETGAIVTVSYLSAEALVPGYELLGVCKAALQTTAANIALALGPAGIRVNVVSAPPFPSSSAVGHPRFEALSQAYIKHSVIRRVPSIEDVIKVIGFLVSDDAAGISGERLFVDGGFHHMAAV